MRWGEDPPDDIVGRGSYCYFFTRGQGLRLGETCCGGSEETGELRAVEASCGVDGWNGDVEVEDGDVEVHSVFSASFP